MIVIFLIILISLKDTKLINFFHILLKMVFSYF
jgi:hypothetical protein